MAIAWSLLMEIGSGEGSGIAGKRHDDLGVLQVAHAWEAMRLAPRPWPEPPAAVAG